MNDVPPDPPHAAPTITFYRAIPESFEPMRADRAALGVIPTAAFQYCEALTSASAFGWGFSDGPREKLSADARTSPGGYRSYHFWHSGFRGGK